MAIIDLSVPLSSRTPHHHTHPPLSIENISSHPAPEPGLGLSFALERLQMGTHVGTHMDAPSHVAVDGCFPTGKSAETLRNDEGGYEWAGAETLQPFDGQAHIVDAAAVVGRELTPSDAVSAHVFDAWFADRAIPRAGDAVLVHTGWIRHFADAESYEGRNTGLPGVSLSGAKWMTDHGVALTGSDTLTFEHKMHPDQPAHAVHRHLLFTYQVPIIECLDLSQLVARRIEKTRLVAAPLAIIGASGAPVRPVALI